MAQLVLFLKSQVAGYTRSDGSIVKPHSRIQRKAGDRVYFPHPKKPGKKALGKYVGQDGEKDRVLHDEHGEMSFHHSEVTGAAGVPKQASAAGSRDAGDAVRAEREKNAGSKTMTAGADHSKG